MEQIIKNKKVLVIGLGISGRSSVKFLLRRGAQVSAVDRNLDLLSTYPEIAHLVAEGLSVMHDSQHIEINHFDLVIVSPGVPQSDKHYAAALKAGIEVLGEVELACRFINSKQPFLAVTGTNGKTTTTLLIEHVLNHCGKPAIALGNVGLPITTEIDEGAYVEDKIIVAELSSFQLDTLKSKVVDAGVVLNITPDHLDRYLGMMAYAASKLHLLDCMKSNGKFYVFESCYNEFKALFKNYQPLTYGYSPTSTFYTDKESLFFNKQLEYFLPEEYKGLESHDLENMIAAYALCKEMGLTADQFLEGFSTFKKPSHRLEFVRTVNDIDFYDDSKGTNIDAVIRAVNTLKGEIILIAGGVDKGAAYSPWIGAFAGRVKCVFAIGQASQKIKEDLSTKLKVEECSSLEEAVIDATKLAKPGQVVLLSPGCSSFDMFRDYAHRGEEFKRIVNALI